MATRTTGTLAGGISASWRGSRRRISIALALVVLALLGAVIATPALGVGKRIVDLVWSPSAPPEVQEAFAHGNAHREDFLALAKAAGANLHDRFSPVIPQETRGIFAIETVDGPIYLWAAPTADGRECWLIQTGVEAATGRPLGGGSCDLPDPLRAMDPGIGWTIDRPSIEILSARVYDDLISEVVVELDGAASVTLPVVAGYALGTVPKDERPVAFVGRDAGGNEVTRIAFQANPPPPDQGPTPTGASKRGRVPSPNGDRHVSRRLP